MPDFGIGEALVGLGLGDALGLGGLFGGGAAAEAAGAGAAGAGLFDTGLATIGAGAGGAGAAAGAGGLADIVGTGAGLFGGTTGLEGTLLAGGATGGLDAALGLGGATAAGTAADFLSAPAASGFAPSAAGGVSAFGDIGGGLAGTGGGTGATGGSGAGAGTSVFDTGTAPIQGVGAGGQPAATGAAGVSAPAGVTAPVDPTAAAGTSQAGSAASGAAKSSSISDLLGKAGTGAVNSLVNNPLPVALGAAGLGYNILQGQKQTGNEKALTAGAQQAGQNSQKLVDQGEALTQYLTNGTLPPAYQQQVDQAINDAKTKAISNAAAQGLPTDPTKNTALAATLAGIDNQRSTMQTQVASQLFSSGAGLINAGQGAAGLSGQLYQALVQNDTTQAGNTGKAIATLAAALNGKTNTNLGGTNIQLSAA